MRTLRYLKALKSVGFAFVLGILLVSAHCKRIENLDDKGRVVLQWELSPDETEIIFDLSAETTGFVGFGISPQGGMTGADIFIAGVDSNGKPYSSVSTLLRKKL